VNKLKQSPDSAFPHCSVALITAGLLSLAVHSVHAQQRTATDELTEIIVTAEKREERLQDVPVPVAVLSADVLADNGQVQLRDYYSSVPGLNLSPSIIGHQTLSIRGITTGGFTDSTVGIMIDDAPFGSAAEGLNEIPDLDPSDLARVEVLRGPQGTLYGASGMGGVLKFVTVDPSTEHLSGRAEAGTNIVHNGSELGYNLRGSANVPLSDALALRVSGFTRQDAGYIDNPTANIDGVNEAAAYGGRAALLWKPSDAVSLKASALYQHYRANDTSEVYVGVGLGDLQHNSVPGSGKYERTIQAYSATLEAQLGALNLTSVSSYSVNKFNIGADYSLYFGAATTAQFGVAGNSLFQFANEKKYTQEVRLTASTPFHLDWLLGAFYTHDGIQPVNENDFAVDAGTGRVSGVGFVSGGDGGAYQEYAAFVDLTYHFSNRFDVQIGGRESRLNLYQLQNTITGPLTPPLFGADSPFVLYTPGITADVFTYLFTPRFRVSDDLMFYARLASGYRPGSPNGIVSGVPPFSKPDKTRNYEIGVKASFLDDRLSIDGSVYYIDWKDIQISLHTDLGIQYGTNGGNAKSEGVELSLTARPIRSTTLSAWVSYDDAVLTQSFPGTSPLDAYGVAGDRLPFSSRFSGSVSAQQEFSLSGTVTGFSSLTVSYVGNRIGVFSAGSPDRQTYPGYGKTDVQLGAKSDSWSANLYVNNIADARGQLSGGTGYYLPYSFVFIQPRTVGLTLSHRF
jgi:iron complex outermembrane receptor protein